MQIKFLTLNLYEGGRFFDAIVEFIRSEQPDILALQEVFNGKDKNLPKKLRSLEELKQQLKDYYYHFAPELLVELEEGKIDAGNAIFSRFPLVAKKVVFFDIRYGTYTEKPPNGDYSLHPKNMHYVTIRHNHDLLNVFNLHGIWGFDGNDNERRLKMSKIIVEQIKGKENVILAGDFNVRPRTQTIKNIEKQLVNVFKNKLKTTFNMKHKANSSYATAVVDMVFISKDIKVLEHYCPQVDISDHLPLVCILETAN